MHLDIRESGKSAVLTLDGELDKRHEVALSMYLWWGLSCVDDLLVDCGRVTGVDAACLQALCSAYLRSQKMKKRFTLTGCLPELLQRTRQALSDRGCAERGADCGRGCIWDLRQTAGSGPVPGTLS